MGSPACDDLWGPRSPLAVLGCAIGAPPSGIWAIGPGGDAGFWHERPVQDVHVNDDRTLLSDVRRAGPARRPSPSPSRRWRCCSTPARGTGICWTTRPRERWRPSGPSTKPSCWWSRWPPDAAGAGHLGVRGCPSQAIGMDATLPVPPKASQEGRPHTLCDILLVRSDADARPAGWPPDLAPATTQLGRAARPTAGHGRRRSRAVPPSTCAGGFPAGSPPTTSSYRPVEPKPPAPRSVAGTSSTTSQATRYTGATTSCATRSPRSTRKGACPRFTSATFTSPR